MCVCWERLGEGGRRVWFFGGERKSGVCNSCWWHWRAAPGPLLPLTNEIHSVCGCTFDWC